MVANIAKKILLQIGKLANCQQKHSKLVRVWHFFDWNKYSFYCWTWGFCSWNGMEQRNFVIFSFPSYGNSYLLHWAIYYWIIKVQLIGSIFKCLSASTVLDHFYETALSAIVVCFVQFASGRLQKVLLIVKFIFYN